MLISVNVCENPADQAKGCIGCCRSGQLWVRFRSNVVLNCIRMANIINDIAHCIN